MSPLSGYCLCKSIRFEVNTPTHLDACHCVDCRRWNGGPYIGMDFTSVTFTENKTLRWYQSSEWAERGFCHQCGSSLFYRLIETPDQYSICMGAVENMPGDLSMTKEFFIDQKPSAYAFEGDRERLTGQQVFALYADKKDQTDDP